MKFILCLLALCIALYTSNASAQILSFANGPETTEQGGIYEYDGPKRSWNLLAKSSLDTTTGGPFPMCALPNGKQVLVGAKNKDGENLMQYYDLASKQWTTLQNPAPRGHMGGCIGRQTTKDGGVWTSFYMNKNNDTKYANIRTYKDSAVVSEVAFPLSSKVDGRITAHSFVPETNLLYLAFSCPDTPGTVSLMQCQLDGNDARAKPDCNIIMNWENQMTISFISALGKGDEILVGLNLRPSLSNDTYMAKYIVAVDDWVSEGIFSQRNVRLCDDFGRILLPNFTSTKSTHDQRAKLMLLVCSQQAKQWLQIDKQKVEMEAVYPNDFGKFILNMVALE